MISFERDYSEGCHPLILEKLSETNLEQTEPYGEDDYCLRAAESIKKICDRCDIDVHFMVGGTQANLTVISSILRPYQGVLCADSGHIAVHETGAIEACGHKVLTLPTEDGTITAEQIARAYDEHFSSPTACHCVQPGMVYISQPTEKGTLYNKVQLIELYNVCKKRGLPLYIDGARLGYGLASPLNDLSIEDIANLCDVFYIGGTKCGAMFGEAVVLISDKIKTDFRYAMKQRGGLLAKGRMLGVQFDVLFADNLYLDICCNAVKYALEIKAAFIRIGVEMYVDSSTNQQFPLLTRAQINTLSAKYKFEEWEPFDDVRILVRFCTSWATTREQTDLLIADIEGIAR